MLSGGGSLLPVPIDAQPLNTPSEPSLYNDLSVGDTLILHALGVKWDRSLPDVSRRSRKAAQSSLLSAERS